MSKRELVILGTSAQQHTRYRNHGAYLLWWHNEGLLFDPGEGTQRQFIFANISPTIVSRIFISHFHGDHCLGLGSILLRLNLDKVKHTIHCYYPADGKKYFDRIRYSTIYHEVIDVKEHPISEEGIVSIDDNFVIEATFLHHKTTNIAWKIKESDERKFYKDKIKQLNISGPMMKALLKEGKIFVDNKSVYVEDISWIRKGSSVAVIIDTLYKERLSDFAKNATILLCESTYNNADAELAKKHLHMTSKQAGLIARDGNVGKLVLTHFSARYSSTKGLVKEAQEVFGNVFAAKEFASFHIKK